MLSFIVIKRRRLLSLLRSAMSRNNTSHKDLMRCGRSATIINTDGGKGLGFVSRKFRGFASDCFLDI